MSLNTFISSSPYFCQPNQFSYYILNPIASEVHLPDYDKQNNIITFINNSGNTVTLISKNSPDINLEDNKSITLTPERSNGYYKVLIGNSLNTSGWLTIGNSNVTGGLLGTLTNNNFDIIRNSIPYINLSPTSINFNVPLSMQSVNKIINLQNPAFDNDASNKFYVDNKFQTIIGASFHNTNLNDSIVLSQPLPSVFKLIVNAYVTNFTSWMTSSHFGHVVTTSGSPRVGFNMFICPGNVGSTPSLTPQIQLVVNVASLGGNTLGFNCTFMNGITGYDIYVLM